MILLSVFGIILILIGIGLMKDGFGYNKQYPQCVNTDGNKYIIVGIFIFLAGISVIIVTRL